MFKSVKKRELLPLLLIFLSSSMAALALFNGVPMLGMIRNWAEDFQVATLTPRQPPHDSIVFVSITEETLAQFPYRSPVDRQFLADLLETLRNKGARAVAVDLLFDQPTEPDKDARLRQVIRDYPLPLVVSYATEVEHLTPEQVAYINDFLPLHRRGFANLVKDPFDQTARLIYVGRKVAETPMLLSFSHRLAVELGTVPVPEQRPIVWRFGPDAETPPFSTYPSHTVAFLPDEWFKDKVVLIGADLPLDDRHRTPLAASGAADTQEIPGTLVHAQSLATLLDDSPSPKLPLERVFATVVLAAALGVLLGQMTVSVVLLMPVVAVGMLVILLGGFGLYHELGVFFPVLEASLALLLSIWFTAAYTSRSERQRKKFIQQAFSRYLSKELVNQLADDPTKLTRSAERRELTFVFTDVEGFTTVSEQTEPTVLAAVMNAYLDGACKKIIHNGGMIVDIIGDAVFGMFGAPINHPDHAQRAVRAAREIDQFSLEFRSRPEVAAIGFGRTRIGVHTGNALVGNFGSEERFKYVPLGDAVNTGSRVEGLNKYFLTRVCVSGTVLAKAPETPSRPIGEIVLKGRSEPLLIHELRDIPERDTELLEAYGAAYRLLEQGAREEAMAAFAAVVERWPDDGCARFHLNRLREQPEARNHVVVMAGK
ncbi:MAG: adenylate/guanylate cyclase domain-containing protein [Magnetococcus sp. WYHC-3]